MNRKIRQALGGMSTASLILAGSLPLMGQTGGGTSGTGTGTSSSSSPTPCPTNRACAPGGPMNRSPSPASSALRRAMATSRLGTAPADKILGKPVQIFRGDVGNNQFFELLQSLGNQPVAFTHKLQLLRGFYYYHGHASCTGRNQRAL